ncbi:hypothetical protein [Deinococcus pimensis]|uniref:hypothetical protein n=1 Tax=Deinococcus pimensis TaxID=309888 RepID=UPI0004BC3E5B|nr:hypothetical protein [Deinococcus pimensis]
MMDVVKSASLPQYRSEVLQMFDAVRLKVHELKDDGEFLGLTCGGQVDLDALEAYLTRRVPQVRLLVRAELQVEIARLLRAASCHC